MCSQQVREKGWRNEKDHIPTVDSDGDAGGEFAPPRASHVGADDESNASDEGGRNTYRA